jgi:hypothetical protein
MQAVEVEELVTITPQLFQLVAKGVVALEALELLAQMELQTRVVEVVVADIAAEPTTSVEMVDQE